MLIIGHELVEFSPFIEVSSPADIDERDNFLFKFSEKLVKICKENGRTFSVYASTKTQVILANAFGAKFIIVPNKFIPVAQKLADDYIFDSKIATVIRRNSQIDKMADLGIDAVIFYRAIDGSSVSFKAQMTNLQNLPRKIRKMQLPKVPQLPQNGATAKINKFFKRGDE